MEFARLDFENPKLLYLQVADIIEEGITSNKFKVGEKIPPERELLKTLGVSLGTVKEALGKLERDGYLSRRPSIGTVVINSKPKHIDLTKKNEICLVVCLPEKAGWADEPGTYENIQRTTRGIEEKVKEKGCYLIYSSFNNNELSFTEKMNEIAGLIVTGIVTPEHIRIIRKLHVPFVLIGDIWEKTTSKEETDIIANDDFQGSYLATGHLAGLGHKRIVFITPSMASYPWYREQLRGYKEALAERNIDCDDELVIETGTSGMEGGYKSMKEFLEKSIPFTAVYCPSGTMGMGALKAIREKGLRIPEDISMITDASQELTTVTYDFEEMGRKAFERLLDRITNTEWKPQRVIIPNRLIVRDSAINLDKVDSSQ